MRICRAILRLLFGERGPADLVVTRNAADTHIRLPNRHPHLRLLSALLVVLLVLGAYAIYLVIAGTLRFPEEDRDYPGMAVCVVAIVLAMIAACLKLHVNWHYEVVLTVADLSVLYVSTGGQWRLARIEMAPIRQLTVIPRGSGGSLQAEATDDTPRLLLQNQDHQLLLQLADLVAAEHARLQGMPVAIRVKVEEVAVGASGTRLEPPLNSKVEVTQHEAGVTLDFPLPEDDRERVRRRAWRTFEIGLFLMGGSVIWIAACFVLNWQGAAGWCIPAFFLGVGTLIAAANMMTGVIWDNKVRDDDLHQLSALGNLLIRTTRDHRKQIWYRDEIRDIAVADWVETTTTASDGDISYPTSTYHVELMLLLHTGEKVLLLERTSAEPADDYRKKAELEWIATVLRQSLHADCGATPPVSSHAIKAMDGYADETHVKK